MLFSSIPFLYYFLPLVLAVYFLTPRGEKTQCFSFRASVLCLGGTEVLHLHAAEHRAGLRLRASD